MTILNEYLSYLNEEDKEKKSKLKDKLKKYGKYALGAAAVGAAAYVGSKAIDKHNQSKTLRGRFNKKTREGWENAKDRMAKAREERKERAAEKIKQKEKRHKRNVETTKSKYKRWKRSRERAQDTITRQGWLDKLQDKVKGDEGKKPGIIKRWKNRRKEKSIVKKLKYKVGLD